ncbi:MAG: hypothetical protein WBQ18_04930 [Solirubrobacteraceae bacterium]
MTATAEPPPTAAAVKPETPSHPPLSLGEGVELLGEVPGSGYQEGASLVRRGDGQMVHLGPLQYGLLECVDGERDVHGLAASLSERLGRQVGPEHVVKIADKLARQGLLAGTEFAAPPRRNPLLALRWKVLVTDPALTRRLTTPLTFLFRPWVMLPVLAGFIAVFWFVLFDKGIASATAQAFHSPGLLLLVFGLAVVSAGFHELGHASACRYGGATPSGMGMGLYLVWPAFYTDVTDSYRLPKRDRLRVDLGGMYFNAIIAVVTMGVWLLIHVDALLLLIGLQVLEMVKNLSPMIRSDGYHILSDVTGIPDLFSHMGPTLRRLLPGHRHEPSALTGRARLLVTLWVLIIVPILLSMSFSAVLLLPKLVTSAFDSSRHIITAIPHEAGQGQILDVIASVLRLVALVVPVAGSAVVTNKIVRMVVGKARAFSAGNPARQVLVSVAGAAAVGLMIWAWWPSGQYQPVRANQGGTVLSMAQLVSAPASVARPVSAPAPAGVQRAPLHLAPGTHLAVSMIPVGGATRRHPALFVVSQGKGKPPVAVLSGSAPPPPAGTATATIPTTASATSSTTASPTPAPSSSSATAPAPATAFPFTLPSAPGPNDSQALAVNRTSGGVMYDVAYSLVTVSGGAPVTEKNSAFALANCNACTTVAVSFQVVLIVGRSKYIAPIDAAGAENGNCPACVTTALADQIVVTLKSQPSATLLAQLQSDLKQLNALPQLGAGGTPAAVTAQVTAIQQQIDQQLSDSGQLANPPQPTSTSATNTATTSTTSTAPSTQTATTPSTPAATTPAPASSTAAAPPPTTTTTPTTSTSTATTTAPTTSTTTTAPASGAPAASAGTSTAATPGG